MQTFETVINQINKNQIAPFYLLSGTEAYFIDSIEKAIYNQVVTEETKDFDYSLFYGKDTTAVEIIDTAKRFPMLSTFHLIVVREAQYINQSLDPIVSYLENPQPQSIIVFCYKHRSFDKRKKLHQLASKAGVVLSFRPLYDNQIPKWIQSQTKKHKLSISPKALVLLADYLGSDLLKIDKELEKFKLILAEGEEITSALVEKHIGLSKDFNTFELQNAIGTRNISRSFQIVQYMSRNSKNHPLPVILGTLHSFFQKLLKYHGLLKKTEAASLLGINPYFVKDYQEAAQYFSMRQTSQALHVIFQADLKSKGITGGHNQHGAILKDLLLRIFTL